MNVISRLLVINPDHVWGSEWQKQVQGKSYLGLFDLFSGWWYENGKDKIKTHLRGHGAAFSVALGRFGQGPK